MVRITISGAVFECLHRLKIGSEFSNEAIYGWCDGCKLEYYYTTADAILQLLRLNGYIERLSVIPYRNKKSIIEYRLIKEIPEDFTYTRLININKNRRNNEKTTI